MVKNIEKINPIKRELVSEILRQIGEYPYIFGGPYVKFIWEDGGWIMEFCGKHSCDERSRNMDILRFLAMRRAGYPVVYGGWI